MLAPETIMYYPFQRDGNVKESMLSTSGPAVLDPAGGTGRPFSSSFASAQSQAANATGFHHGGSVPSLHSVQTNYTLQNMPSFSSQRNPGVGMPSSAAPQTSGNLAAARFSAANIQGALPQSMSTVSHSGLHGHGGMGLSRAGLGVSMGHPFSGGSVNGSSTGPGPSIQGGAASLGNPRGAQGAGLSVNAAQLGGASARLANLGGNVSMSGGAEVSSLSSTGTGSSLSRGLNAGVGLNMAALNGTWGMNSVGLGPPGSSAGTGAQGPGRPAGMNLLQQQQGAGMPSSTYNPSDNLLAIINRAAGTQGAVSLLGNNFASAPGVAFSGGQQQANAGLRKSAVVNALMQQNSEFSIQNEDFPALPGAKAGGGELGTDLLTRDQQHENALAVMQSQHLSMGRSGSFGLGSTYMPQQHQHQSQQQMLGHQGTSNSQASLRAGLGQYEQLISQHQHQQHQQSLRLGQQQQQQPIGTQVTSKDTGLKQAQSAVAGHDRFTLLGLLGVIRMSDPDLTTLALGTDLTTLGLNLNSRENLYKTFASPWADGPVRGEPEFTLPACYVQPAPKLQHGYFNKFQQDTLFYIFYSMPNDEAQLFAADELCNRGWFYHKEHQMWFTRVPNTEPLVKTASYERGSYYFFDPTVWETGRKDNFVLHYEALEARPQLPATTTR